MVSTPSASPLTTVILFCMSFLTTKSTLLTPISDTFLEPTTETLLPFSSNEKSPPIKKRFRAIL